MEATTPIPVAIAVEAATAITTTTVVMVCREATSMAAMAFLVRTTMADMGPALVDSKVDIKASMEARRSVERTELEDFRRVELTVLEQGFRSGSVDNRTGLRLAGVALARSKKRGVRSSC